MPDFAILNISPDTLQLVTEQATISKRQVERGHVVVRTRVEEHGVLIVPVIEERAVIRTELVLKEEIRIAGHSTHETIRRSVRLRAEHAEIVRLHEPEAGSASTEED